MTRHIEDFPTRVLLNVACRVTPIVDADRWVATADNRRWTFDRAAQCWDATNGTRDQQGISVVTTSFTEADFREFLLEQLEHYGVTFDQICHMTS